MITVLGCQVVILSTKAAKTKKIARYVLKIMRRSGKPMIADGVGEARFDDEAGFVCFSGKPDAERESDTAHIVLVDESQDIPHFPVYGDISPMRAGTTGILVCLGIGGTVDSFGEKMMDDPRALKLIVPWQEVVAERPHYKLTVDDDRRKMLPWEFAANYECNRIEEGVTLLIPEIKDWDEAFPGVPFDRDFIDRNVPAGYLETGIDWGRRVDFSCGITMASFMPPGHVGAFDLDNCLHVIFATDLYGGGGWKKHLKGLVEWLTYVPWDRVRPEVNGVGDVLYEFLASDIKESFEGTDDSSVYGIWTDREKNSQAWKRIALASFSGRLFFARPPDKALAEKWDPKHSMDKVLGDLRSARVEAGIGGILKIPGGHPPDPLAALTTLFYNVRPGEIYETGINKAA